MGLETRTQAPGPPALLKPCSRCVTVLLIGKFTATYATKLILDDRYQGSKEEENSDMAVNEE